MLDCVIYTNCSLFWLQFTLDWKNSLVFGKELLKINRAGDFFLFFFLNITFIEIF
jgi:hypothetical protein